MRLHEPISLTGYFWLPTKKKKIPGTLTIDQYASSRIELQGLFGGAQSSQVENQAVIHGVLQNGKSITAVDCLSAGANFQWPGFHRSVFSPARVFLGALLSERHFSKCTRVDFAVDGLDTWLNLPGMSAKPKMRTGKIVGTVLRYRMPEVPSHEITNGFQLSIKFASTLPTGALLTEAKITQTAFLSLTSKPKPLDEFLKAVHQINTFLCFAIDETVTLTILRIVQTLGPKAGAPSRLHTIDVIFRSLPHAERQPRVEYRRLLLPYSSISTYLGDMISKWFGAREDVQAALNLYVAATTASHAFIETRFLFLVQAIETFHRKTSDATEMDPALFSNIRDKLLLACPAGQLPWLKSRLEYANELSLRKRLRQLIGKFAHLLGDKKKCDDFVQRVVSTRNYLTHYDQKSKQASVSGEALIRLAIRIEGLMTVLLLDRLGLSLEAIEQLNRRDSRLKHKLNGTF